MTLSASSSSSSTPNSFKNTPIAPFTGRPERQKAINSDDITDLKIALNTPISWEEFLRSI